MLPVHVKVLNAAVGIYASVLLRENKSKILVFIFIYVTLMSRFKARRFYTSSHIDCPPNKSESVV